ncbi:hypothetical protein BGZ68_010317, partial [Mortierella alpina]
RFKRVLYEEFGLDPDNVENKDTFHEHGIDEASFNDLIEAIEEEFGTDLPAAEVDKLDTESTVQQLIDLVSVVNK